MQGGQVPQVPTVPTALPVVERSSSKAASLSDLGGTIRALSQVIDGMAANMRHQSQSVHVAIAETSAAFKRLQLAPLQTGKRVSYAPHAM